ncbi:MAG: hypothetical protein E3J35_10335 [Methanomassiliicoccales archaeon]|nr:MAG: hypothetical protein E3J35_10335 [Methanomassiliicoccales archaeon]
MTNLNVKEVSKMVREYFDEIKKSKFIFDVISVEYDDEEDAWTVSCEVANVFDEEPRHYEVKVDDETEEISDVREID